MAFDEQHRGGDNNWPGGGKSLSARQSLKYSNGKEFGSRKGTVQHLDSPSR